MEPVNLDNTKALERIAEAVERIAEAEARAAGLTEQVVQRTGAEPAGIPIRLIVEVLIALIGVLVRHVVADRIAATKLRELRQLLLSCQPVRPAGKEAE